MLGLDTNRILNGTDSKVLYHKFEDLKSDYSDEKAKEYKAFYLKQPLSLWRL